MIKSKEELEKQIQFYKYLKSRNSSIEGHFDVIELEDLEDLSEDAWEILNNCGKVILRLDTCNGMSIENLKKLSINKKIIYQFQDDRNEEGYCIDDLFILYNILETFKYVTNYAENNIHKIIITCNIISWLVWYEDKGNVHNEDSNDNVIIDTRSLKGSLFKGIAVCGGYALVVKIILNYLGIETTIVGGSSINEFHAWNQVKDDFFYNLDITLDRPAFLMDLPLDNMLKGDEQFYTNHNVNVSWEDYTQLKKCPKSIPNNDLRYYLKTIPEDLKRFLVENQAKGLYTLLKYREQFFNQYNMPYKSK